MYGALYFLRIEVDGHFHGGPPVKPWVAEITGTCPRYGLARDFIRPMNDWAGARVAWSGNTYGVIATFPLREGRLYEVQRCEGNSSKRHDRTRHPRARHPRGPSLGRDARAREEILMPDPTSIRLPDELAARVRARAGGDGMGPTIRRDLERLYRLIDLADADAPVTLDQALGLVGERPIRRRPRRA